MLKLLIIITSFAELGPVHVRHYANTARMSFAREDADASLCYNKSAL